MGDHWPSHACHTKWAWKCDPRLTEMEWMLCQAFKKHKLCSSWSIYHVYCRLHILYRGIYIYIRILYTYIIYLYRNIRDHIICPSSNIVFSLYIIHIYYYIYNICIYIYIHICKYRSLHLCQGGYGRPCAACHGRGRGTCAALLARRSGAPAFSGELTMKNGWVDH